MWSGGSATNILNLGIKWRSVVSFTPRLLYPWGKSPWFTLGRRVCGLQSQYACSFEERNISSLLLLEIRPWLSSL